MIKAGHSSTTSIRSPQILAANSLLIPLFKDLLGPQRSAYPSQSWLALLCPRQGLVGPLKQPHFPSQICSLDHQCLNQVVDHLRLMQMSYSFPGGFRIDIISLLSAHSCKHATPDQQISFPLSFHLDWKFYFITHWFQCLSKIRHKMFWPILGGNIHHICQSSHRGGWPLCAALFQGRKPHYCGWSRYRDGQT